MERSCKFLSILLYPLPVLLNSFPRTFIIKDNANYGRNPPSCPFPVIAFINKETTLCINEDVIDAINESAIGAIIALRTPPSCFSYFMF